jgi:transketolase
MVGVAVGCATRNRTIPFCSTFAAFFTRAADQIRMGAISLANVKFCGSHVGCSIGEDGPSQMALEDLGLFRTIPDSIVFYPSDAVSTEYAVELAANCNNMVYIRTSRPNTPVIYKNDEHFEVGKAKVVRHSENDLVTIVTAGVTLHEAMKVKKNVRVIDVFTVKPIDYLTIIQNLKETNNRLLVVEDHYKEGGIGDEVSNAVLKHADMLDKVQYKHVYVTNIPKSGLPEELLHHYGLDAEGIENAVNSFF